MGREAFVIVDGSATVKRNGKKVATLGPGAVVGELSLLDHGPRTATVTTDTDTTVLVIDQRHFLGVLDERARARRASCWPPWPGGSASSTASTTASNRTPRLLGGRRAPRD